ncbi:MAG: hypothetical protein K2L18_10400, partial [Acetatifactor sp.]|nr:hypothetical protein [Acetatifactor sp.]
FSSIIENVGKIEPELAKAVFTFKTEEEILHEINGKLRKYMKDAIQFSTLDQVGRQRAGELNRQMDSNAQEGEKGHISDFIAMYIENYHEWSDLIKPTDSSEAERIFICEDKSEIQKYVAKHDGGDQENGGSGAIPFYRYIAVKKAEIYCNFKLTDVNQLRLVDTVGLGDIEDGTTDKMYQAIDRDSDAVLYLFRPVAGKGGMIDDRTYDILNHEMYPRYKYADLKKWMGVVINNDGTNLTECIDFQRKFEINAPEMAQNVVFKEIIDVSQTRDVRKYSVLPILASLSQNLGNIDARIEKTTGALIEKANESFAALKNICCEVRVPAQEDIISEKFIGIFRGFDEAARSLGSEFMQENAGQKHTFLEDSLEQVSSLKEAETASIREKFHYGELSSQRSLAFGELHRVVRKIGSREATEFEATEKDFKRQLAQKFLETFGFEKSKCPAPESNTFFLEMAEQLFRQNPDWQMLKDAFLSIHAFKLDETKGITKLLFNENAERFLNGMD